MTTNAIFDQIAASLTAFCGSEKALFSRARDPFEILELLGNSPGSYRVIACWMGEKPAGDSAHSGIVESEFIVTVSANRGMPAVFGAQLSVARAAGEEPLWEKVCKVRNHLRAFTFTGTGTEGRLRYGGTTPVAYEGARLDAYELSFSVFHNLTA